MNSFYWDRAPKTASMSVWGTCSKGQSISNWHCCTEKCHHYCASFSRFWFFLFVLWRSSLAWFVSKILVSPFWSLLHSKVPSLCASFLRFWVFLYILWKSSLVLFVSRILVSPFCSLKFQKTWFCHQNTGNFLFCRLHVSWNYWSNTNFLWYMHLISFSLSLLYELQSLI